MGSDHPLNGSSMDETGSSGRQSVRTVPLRCNHTFRESAPLKQFEKDRFVCAQRSSFLPVMGVTLALLRGLTFNTSSRRWVVTQLVSISRTTAAGTWWID